MYASADRVRARELIAAGTSISAASRELAISRSAIRSWMRTSDPGPLCPAPAKADPAYAALFGFYLGDGCVSAHPRTFALRVSCDASWPGIVDDVDRCMRLIHPERRTYLVRAPGTVVVHSYWKHWSCLFPQHGRGRKHERTLLMEPWQLDIVRAYPAAFLRGLFHSDGCLVQNRVHRIVDGIRREHVYPRWQFVNASPDIMRWCGDALDLVDVAWRRSGPRTLSVSRRDDVARLTALIGVKC